MSIADRARRQAAEKFFYDHAGFSYDPATETPDEGKERGAARLADAEERLLNGPYYIDVVEDDEPWDGDFPYDGPLWNVDLYSVAHTSSGELIGSLGGVAAERDDPYMRVVAAELALEYIPES